jgi:orotidine-5'-phosphate decarboxylase
MTLRFREKLTGASLANNSHLCVGLDPDYSRTPVDDVAALNRAVIEATSDLVCCYKPNIAFYEAYGTAGYAALRLTLDEIPRHIPVLIDAKRGDVGSTAESYAHALFDLWGADAVTVNPYLGRDSLEPFLRRGERGVFIVCRTSNPGAVDLQDLQVSSNGAVSEPLYLAVAARANAWNENGNVGLVVGATYPAELAEVRRRCPTLPILVPGVGAQEGALEQSVRAAANGSVDGFLVSASRAVMYASSERGTRDAARSAAARLRDEINAVLRGTVEAGSRTGG